MAGSSSAVRTQKTRSRSARLEFRVDASTRALVEHAAALERRTLTDFCLTALTEATEATIQRHQVLTLSPRDREMFFDTLVRPPRPNARLRRAFRSARKLVVPG